MILFWWLQTTVPPVAGKLELDGFWPQTAVGWITFFVAFGGLLAMIYGYMRGVAHLNGLGGRLKKVEDHLSTIDGQNIERDKAFALLVQAQGQLTIQIGEAKKAAEQCDTKSGDYFIQIGSRLKEMSDKMDISDREAHGRLSAIETELRLRNQALPLYIDKK